MANNKKLSEDLKKIKPVRLRKAIRHFLNTRKKLHGGKLDYESFFVDGNEALIVVPTGEPYELMKTLFKLPPIKATYVHICMGNKYRATRMTDLSCARCHQQPNPNISLYYKMRTEE